MDREHAPARTSTATKAAVAHRPDPMLNLRGVMAETGLGRSTLYRMIKAGNFPQPYQLCDYRIGWPLSEVRRWRDERPRGLGERHSG